MRLRRSSMATMLVLLVLLAVTIVSTLALQSKLRDTQLEAADLASQNTALAANNEEIKDDIRSLGSDDSVVEIARDRLNYCFEDETIYIDKDQ